MRTSWSGDGRARGLLARRSVWVLTAAGALGAACAAAERPSAGPRPEPPEYVAPYVLPWDAGASAEPEDPFAAAAAGDWLPPAEPKKGAMDAGSDVPNPSREAEADGAAPSREDAGEGSPMRLLDAGDTAAEGRAR
jgi:hypothetical protein